MAFRILLAALLLCAGCTAPDWRADATAGLKCFQEQDGDCAYPHLQRVGSLSDAELSSDPDLAIRALWALSRLEAMRKGDRLAPVEKAIALHDRLQPPPRASVLPALIEKSQHHYNSVLATRHKELLANADGQTGDDQKSGPRAGVMTADERQARETLLRIQEIAAATLPPDDRQWIDVRMTDTALAELDGDWDSAERAMRDAEERLIASPDDDGPRRLLRALDKLVYVQEMNKKLPQATGTRNRSIEILRRQQGTGYTQLWRFAIDDHARLLALQGRCAEARDRVRELEAAYARPGMFGEPTLCRGKP